MTDYCERRKPATEPPVRMASSDRQKLRILYRFLSFSPAPHRLSSSSGLKSGVKAAALFSRAPFQRCNSRFKVPKRLARSALPQKREMSLTRESLCPAERSDILRACYPDKGLTFARRRWDIFLTVASVTSETVRPNKEPRRNISSPGQVNFHDGHFGGQQLQFPKRRSRT